MKCELKMSKEDREYFKNGVKTLCGTELLCAAEFVNGMKPAFDKGDFVFMKRELGKQAGAIWAQMLRALKKMDFEEAERVLTGGARNDG